MDYILHEWGGPDEQAADIAAGNPFAKNWHEEAMKVLEDAVCSETSSCAGAELHTDGDVLCTTDYYW